MYIKAQQHKEIISAVNVVGGTFYVASLQKTDIHKISHALLHVFLLRSTPHFFSYTEAFGQVTLVLDHQSLNTFPRNCLVVSHGWRALEVTLGECGYTESGVISRLTSALAKHKISIHYLSTYNTDYILVPEHQLGETINCFKRNFNIQISADGDVDEAAMEATGYLTTPDLPRIHLEAESPESPKLILSPAALCLISVDKEEVPLCMDTILHLIFFPNRSEEMHFLSFTDTPTELSMILDQRDIADFPEVTTSRKLLVERFPWRAIKRMDKPSVPLSAGETERVNAISTPLADAMISLLYISVSNTSVVLVRENNIKKAVDTLRNRGFEFVESMQ